MGISLQDYRQDSFRQPAYPAGRSAPEKPPEPSFDLVVSEDKLKAFLHIQGQQRVSLNIWDIKIFLREKGIRHGLVPESVFEEWLKNGALWDGPCQIAQGIPAEPGQDARVTYHFEKDPLRIAVIKAGGGIDFKDKGEIPQVKTGALLGEKTPLVKEKRGKDVYGETITVARAKDLPLIPGPGVGASADRLKVYAQRNGRPVVDGDGKVSVFTELNISGDVALRTGHIRFDGFVDISGAIQAGFKVKGGRVAVTEILRAEVESDGDIVVNGGIIGSKVVCRGNLKTRFIQSSQVEAGGDVIVEREIIDSRVESRGSVIAQPRGKIIASRILATKGVTVTQIGTPDSKPCVLTVGVDSRHEALAKNLQEQIAVKRAEQKRLQVSIEVLNQGSAQLQEEIVRLVQVRDRAAAEQLSCRRQMEAGKEKNGLSQAVQAQREMEKLEEKRKSAEERLFSLMPKDSQLTEKIAALQFKIDETENAVLDLQDEAARTVDEFERKEIAPIRVVNDIFPGTIFEGCHCKLKVREMHRQTLVKEVDRNANSNEKDISPFWEFEFFPLPIQ